MNAITGPSSTAPVIPDSAPFSPAQRAWLNGFLAGLFGAGSGEGAGMSMGSAPAEAEDFPWHDPALEMDERLALAEGRPFERKLMAAMAQLDCGQCGYLCQTYAEALASGKETSTSLCVPGAKPTTKKVKELLAERPADSIPATAAEAAPAAPPAHGLPVLVMAADRLTGIESAKDVRHIRIDLTPSGMIYEPGDSIGIAAPNDTELVVQCLAALGADGHEFVPCHDGTMRPIREAFATQLDIARPQDRTMLLMSMVAKDPAEAAALRRLADGDDGAEPADADLLDLLEAFPSARPRLMDLAKSLPSLRPRLYSIASSHKAEPGQVSLCVSVVKAVRRGRVRHGVASAFLAHRAAVHGQILANIQVSHFRLPPDPATPVIMVGPGTGIAPFRAFLQERAVTKATGPAWLFFGDQHAASDFLFEAQLKAWLQEGVLSRLDTAWSRDQAKKVYVQDRMRESAAELWRWLQDGAYFYVCGDASRMAKDVDTALRDVAAQQGGLSEAEAKDWIAALARQGRYLRDVY
jgi:sulfite reductase (NADPH) flavoprotein alpha-component